MKTFVIAISLISCCVVGVVVSFQGLDLRKWSSWLFGAISFLCGLSSGFLLSSNLIEGLKVGVILAFVTLFIGATMRRHKKIYNEDKAKFLLLKYGKEEDSSLFAKLVKKLLGKYK